MMTPVEIQTLSLWRAAKAGWTMTAPEDRAHALNFLDTLAATAITPRLRQIAADRRRTIIAAHEFRPEAFPVPRIGRVA